MAVADMTWLAPRRSISRSSACVGTDAGGGTPHPEADPALPDLDLAEPR